MAAYSLQASDAGTADAMHTQQLECAWQASSPWKMGQPCYWSFCELDPLAVLPWLSSLCGAGQAGAMPAHSCLRAVLASTERLPQPSRPAANICHCAASSEYLPLSCENQQACNQSSVPFRSLKESNRCSTLSIFGSGRMNECGKTAKAEKQQTVSSFVGGIAQAVQTHKFIESLSVKASMVH